jgi:acyl carrier protein
MGCPAPGHELSTFETIAQIIGETFSVSVEFIRAETTSHDVAGWDSVTHIHLLLALEDHFQVELPAEIVLKCRNVGELADLVIRRVEPVSRVANVIVFGNCQAQMITGLLNYLFERRSNNVRFHHLLNFHHPMTGWAELSEGVLAAADMVWHQYGDRVEFPHWDRISASCRRIVFPSLDFNLFWPFAGSDPRNKSEPPEFPFGRFPYGDVVALQVVREGLKGEAALRSYAERSRARLARMSMARLEEIEFARMVQREAQCDVVMSDFIRANFRTAPTFHTWNHPAGRPLTELVKRLLIASDMWDPDPQSTLAGELAYCAEHWQPLSTLELPIHPLVAELVGLEWFDPDRRYSTMFGPLTHDEYVLRYIEGGAA